MKRFKYFNLLMVTWLVQAAEADIDPAQDQMIDFAVGGQAILEGVMMRAPSNITMAVRKQDGSIKIEKQEYKTFIQKNPKFNIPILRGFITLVEMMILGTKAINFSANEAVEEPEQIDKPQKKPSKLFRAFEAIMFLGSMLISLAFSAALFQYLPLAATTYLEGQSSIIANNYIFFNLIDALIKVAIFISYIYFLSLFPSFYRMFQYHGSEHKSIFTYENKETLTPEKAKNKSRFHPRCGTSFMLIVFVVGIVVYTLAPRPENFWAFLALRLTFLPIIAGLSFEVLRFSAKHSDHWLVRLSVQPGMWFQRLTTREPDKTQLEVALTSLKNSLEMEREIISQQT